MQTKERPFVEGYDDPMQPRHVRVIHLFPEPESRKDRMVDAIAWCACLLFVAAFGGCVLFLALKWSGLVG